MMEMFDGRTIRNASVYWDKQVKQSCPKCGAPFLLEKTTKKDGTIRYCQNEDCDYKMAVDNTNVISDEKTAERVSTG